MEMETGEIAMWLETVDDLEKRRAKAIADARNPN
jgi:hypothetical protein